MTIVKILVMITVNINIIITDMTRIVMKRALSEVEQPAGNSLTVYLYLRYHILSHYQLNNYIYKLHKILFYYNINLCNQ